MSGSAAKALLAARPRPVADVAARRVLRRGEAAWVFHNPATGAYWRASPRLYTLVGGFDGRVSLAEALAALPDTDAEEREALAQGVAGMLGAGLLRVPGARPPPAPPRGAVLAPLRSLAFTRIRLGDLGRILPVADPLLGWLFTRGGAVLLACLGIALAWAWSGREAELAAQFARLADLTLHDAAEGYLVFVAAKMLHETGHAVAARRMARAEGHDLRVVPWGVSFMFLLPAPYVDASSTWFLASPRRRAVVGLAGVATDLLVAGLAGLAWASIGPGQASDRLFDLVLICGASSLLFNLNPLVRLDGYYVLSDLLGVENLQPRAFAALGRFVLGPLGLAERPEAGDLPPALYALASWCYRWTIYLGIFWLAGGVHWMLAAGVGVVVAILFLGVPLLRGAARLRRVSPARAAPALAIAAGIAGALAFLPVPAWITAQGVVLQDGLALVYPRGDARVVAVAPPGPGNGGAVLRLENQETSRRLAQLAADLERTTIEARQARVDGQGIDAAEERRRALASQAVALRRETESWEVRAAPDALWEPMRALTMKGEWVRRDDQRPLGAVLQPGAASEIRLVLDQWDGPAALAALAADPARPIPLRLRGAGPASFHALPIAPASEARETLPSAALATFAGGPIPAQPDARGEARPTERVWELRLRPLAGEASPALPHGARVEAWIALPDAPLLAQAWRRARQALQRRLAV